MADLSNKALALLLLVAIGASIFSTTLVLNTLEGGITGRSVDSDSGKTNFSITSALSIRFVNALIPFGVGYVNSTGGYDNCHMGTNNTPPVYTQGCVGFNTTVHTLNLTIENDGNVLANVSLNFTSNSLPGNATNFIGGGAGAITDPSFKVRVGEANEPGSCTTFQNASSFAEVTHINNFTVPGMGRVCSGLDFDDNNDLIDIGAFIVIPSDASTGEHTVTVLATACDDGSC